MSFKSLSTKQKKKNNTINKNIFLWQVYAGWNSLHDPTRVPVNSVGFLSDLNMIKSKVVGYSFFSFACKRGGGETLVNTMAMCAAHIFPLLVLPMLSALHVNPELCRLAAPICAELGGRNYCDYEVTDVFQPFSPREGTRSALCVHAGHLQYGQRMQMNLLAWC